MTLALALILAAALVLQHHKDRAYQHAIDRLIRAHDEQRTELEANHQASLAQLADVLKPVPHPDIKELIGLVDRLCQRVQAPEHAIVEHAQAQPLPPMPAAVLPDDDEGWHQAHALSAQLLSKEDLAEQAFEQELSA